MMVAGTLPAQKLRGRWTCATPVTAATNASEGILRRNMTYIVPPVWTACLRERFAGSTFVDVIEADVLGDVTCCSDRVKPSSAVPSLLFRAFASSGLPRHLFDRSRRGGPEAVTKRRRYLAGQRAIPSSRARSRLS